MITINEKDLARSINAEGVSSWWATWDGDSEGAARYRGKISNYVRCFSGFCKIKAIWDSDNGMYIGIEINGIRYAPDFQAERESWATARGILLAPAPQTECRPMSDDDFFSIDLFGLGGGNEEG